MSEIRCGTPSGYTRHQRNKEKPCDACSLAKHEYDKRRLAAPDRTRENRLRASAQQRATTRLRNLYPEVWRVLYAEEKRFAERTAE